MREVLEIIKPSLFICHFKDQEGQACMPYYQCAFDPADGDKVISPSGEFIRFQAGISEIHGWVRMDAIIIDEILEEDELQEKVA